MHVSEDSPESNHPACPSGPDAEPAGTARRWGHLGGWSIALHSNTPAEISSSSYNSKTKTKQKNCNNEWNPHSPASTRQHKPGSKGAICHHCTELACRISAVQRYAKDAWTEINMPRSFFVLLLFELPTFGSASLYSDPNGILAK